MGTCFSGLMCHAPIVIPAVAGSEAKKCRATTRAMREVAARAVASRPDRLVLVSPHSPRRPDTWAAWEGRHEGHLGPFRAPEVRIDLPDAPEVAVRLGLPPISHDRHDLDHGAMVPLSFLWEAGWRGPTAILALSWGESDGVDLGRRIAALEGRTAVIASGDMSHRLIPGAPAGFHARAKEFDAAFVAALRSEDWVRAGAPDDAGLRELAAEDVVDSTRVALGAAGEPQNAEVLSYEGPWGVGYAEAIFRDPEPPLYAVARRSVAARLAGTSFRVPDGGPPTAGVFVTLRKDGELRGCIGHIEPTEASLYREVSLVALASAFDDPRFPPLSRDESGVDFEVSVLEPPEPAVLADLDPRAFGVIVSAGRRRGLLLPDIDGIDTVEAQVGIARKKGGIGPREEVELERFRVRKEVQP